MKISSGKILAIAGAGVLIAGIGVLVALAQQRQDLRSRTDTTVAANDGVLDCDPGTDPYNSNSITVTNNTGSTISNLSSDVFRCPYVPGMVEQYRGSFKCEPTCKSNEPNCLVGVWDADLDQRNVSLLPGESKTFSAPANECEIIQIDVRNSDIGTFDCHNVRSQSTVQPGEIWPGGIAFGISENATGYPECKQPTPTPSPTVPPVNTPTPQLTAPPGVPTYTPIPTQAVVCQSPYQCIPSATCSGKGAQTTAGNCSSFGTDYICCIPGEPVTPLPTRPVAGSVEITSIALIGGLGLVLLALFVL